ncbi:MAG TPA: nuclear transport factor 2 family protein [Trebonia sp.]|jgi:ketosteroid isomerase-like protein|nr:nuclear transport factor 2 family protein [Trebonia sp.]
MNTTEVLIHYYQLANTGDWKSWCELFTEDMVMDEQLAGRVEGKQTLQAMMLGFGSMYASFQNVPRHFVVSDGEAAAVSHITAVTPAGDRIEADVMNYFRVEGDRIAYMANFHDTAPFQVLNQASEPAEAANAR